jgi:predicted ATP-grasp superfamily ATP-dependent carboligase
MKILIIGGGLQGLSFASSLYNKHQISVVSDDIQTKYCRFYKKVYDTSYSNGAKLIELLNLEHYNVLIPISDISVSVISQQKTEIESRTKCKVAVPDYEKVYKVESKSRFMEFCKNNGVPHPKTLQLPLTSHSFSFPALIKPDYSVGARGITRINSIVELDEKFSAVEKRFGSCTIQEFIENTDYYYNVMLYRNPIGEFLGHTITKIVRMYPVNAGSSSCCITVENDELLDICKDCLNKLDWEGMADFDVLQRLDNGEYKIIEINARVPASLKAAEISGVNFPEIIVCDTMGLPVPSYSYKPGKIMRYLGIDIMWQLRSPRRFSTKPSWFKFFGKNIYYQDIYKADPSTWWTWFAEGLRKMRSRINNLKR